MKQRPQTPALLWLWIGALVSPLAAIYSLYWALFFAWRNAAGAMATRAAGLRVYSFLALSVLLAIFFLACTWKLFKNYRQSA